MAVELEITKRVECLYFSDKRADVEQVLEDNGGQDKLEVVPMWNGLHFCGFAIMTPEQYEYYIAFFNAEHAYTGFYDSLKIYQSAPGERNDGRTGYE